MAVNKNKPLVNAKGLSEFNWATMGSEVQYQRDNLERLSISRKLSKSSLAICHSEWVMVLYI